MRLVGLRHAKRLFVQLERDAVFPPNRLEQRLYHYRPSRRIITMPLYSPEEDEMALPIRILNKRSWFVLRKLKIDLDFAAVRTSSLCLAKAVS